jgi:hypothetical protein
MGPSVLRARLTGRYLQNPGDFKEFLEEKSKGNQQLVDLFAGKLDVSHSSGRSGLLTR